MIDTTTRFIIQNVTLGELVQDGANQKRQFYVTLQEVDSDDKLKPSGQTVSVTIKRSPSDPVQPGALYDCTLTEVV